MDIYLDTGNLSEIEIFHKMGIIRGVMTNPTILLREWVTGGMDGIRKWTQQIAKMIAPLPLSVEVTSNDRNEMLEQSEKFCEWGDNVNVKITIHGPQGETENLEVIHKLEQ
jgi:transaldolase